MNTIERYLLFVEKLQESCPTLAGSKEEIRKRILLYDSQIDKLIQRQYGVTDEKNNIITALCELRNNFAWYIGLEPRKCLNIRYCHV
jgi:hypothetical protein